jgi:hypothetical protein
MDVFWVISSKASHSTDRSQVIGELIHAYVSGPMSVKSLHCVCTVLCVFEGQLQQVSQSFLHQAEE